VTLIKRFFLNYKVLTVVFLLLSVVGTVYLVQWNQENRSQAKKGEKSAYDLKREKEEITKLEKKVEEAAANPNASGPGAAADKLAAAQEALKKAKEALGSEINYNAANCGKNGNPGIWCATCGGFCSDGTISCDAAGIAKCGEYPQRGGAYVKNSGDPNYPYRCDCDGGSYYFNKPGVCSFKSGKAYNVTANNPQGSPDYSKYTTTNDNDGLCHVVDFATGTTGTKNTYYCKNKFYGQDDLSTGCQEIANVNLSCFCGTVQIDTGNGFESKTMKCGCDDKKTTEVESPTNTPPKSPTNTPTATSTPTNTPTPTPTDVYTTSTPTPTGTLVPTNTPTATSTPTNTPVPTSTPTGVWLSPTPTTAVYVTQGPSPTRIILPNAGVNFPLQALTVVGVITTLLGFLILL